MNPEITPVTGRPLVSIVSATRNRPESVQRLIASIRRQILVDVEIIIVDDGSDKAFTLDGDVRLIRNDRNIGPCAARNQGFRASAGQFILLCDDDIELIDPNLLRRTCELAEQHPQFGAIGLKQIEPDGKAHPIQPANSDVRVSTTIFFGYAVLFRREAVLGVGGFNESIRYCYEEQELGFRLHDAGWEIMYDPGLAVIHYHDPRGRDWQSIHRQITLNAVRTILMRFPFWWVLPSALVKLVSFPMETRRRGRLDWRGTIWLWGSTFAWMLPSLRARQPIHSATLKKYLQLKRQPVPVV